MKTKEGEKSFFEIHTEQEAVLGFWREEYEAVIKHNIERTYKTEIIKEYYISDIVKSGDKFLLKWKKRYRPLSKEELKEDYGL